MDRARLLIRRRPALAAAALVAAAAVPAGAHDGPPQAGGTAELPSVWSIQRRCSMAEELSAARRAADTGRGPAVVVLGDSYSVDRGGSPAYAWTRRLPGRVHVDAFPGAGFSATASPCGPVSYADRAARAVAGRAGALVVVEGGLNDHAQSNRAVVAGFARLMRALEGHRVLVVGPPLAPDRAAEVPRIDGLLRAAAAAYDEAYLSTVPLDLDYRDGLHPTQRGHRVLGDAVAAVVTRLQAARRPAARPPASGPGDRAESPRGRAQNSRWSR